MNYAAIKNCDIANGPGVRVSLFVSGCRHHCKDCFNPETWDFACGEPFDEAVMDKLLALLAPGYIRAANRLSRRTSRDCWSFLAGSGRPIPKNPSGRSRAISSTATFWQKSSARGRSRRSFCPISTCWWMGRLLQVSKI